MSSLIPFTRSDSLVDRPSDWVMDPFRDTTLDSFRDPRDVGWSVAPRLMRDMNRMSKDVQAMANREARALAPIATADLFETDTSFDCYVDLPGCDNKDITVSITDRFLDITGERKKVFEQDTDFSHVQERSYGRIHRRLAMPNNADTDNAVASYRNGTLSIKVPKIGTGRARKILPLGSA